MLERAILSKDEVRYMLYILRNKRYDICKNVMDICTNIDVYSLMYCNILKVDRIDEGNLLTQDL